MEKLYVLKNFRAWGRLPEDDYDRTYEEAQETAIISRNAGIDKLAMFVNDEKELNVLVRFLGLSNFEDIMVWLGKNSLSINEMRAIINSVDVDAADIAELVLQREFPEYALANYKRAKEEWQRSFKEAVDDIIKDYGLTGEALKILTDGAFVSVDERFFDEAHKWAKVEKEENNRYYRHSRDEVYYGLIRLADECLSAETKRTLVGDKFDKFIMWAAAAADNEVVDKFIYKDKGTYDEERHFYEITIRNLSMDCNMFII